MRKPVQVTTIILAGGQGTRLHPLTLNHSKPAVSYGGRYRLIDIPISNSINSDFRNIFVIAQYLSGELEHHIQQTYHFDSFNPGSVDVLTPQENERGERHWFQGTADAIRKNLPTILKSSADYFLILSGDQLYNMNFQSMVDFAQEKRAELTIASLPVTAQEAKRMGLLKIDEDHNVVDFIEKPKEPHLMDPFLLDKTFFSNHESTLPDKNHYLASMGIYLFTREGLTGLLQQDSRNDFGYHLISTAVSRGKTAAFVYKGYWEDIGTVSSYYEANLNLTDASRKLDTYDEKNPIFTRPTYLPGPKISSTRICNSIICEGSIIEAEEISHSVIGLRSHIKKGTILRDCVMMGNHFYLPPTHQNYPIPSNFWIGEDCLIEKAIIDEHVQIGNRVVLVNKDKLSHYDGNGIYIRDGIIIVTSGAVVPDGFVL
ncbi:MAG: glucose-1-phosphate adenylyltransferase [Verrucomicrobiota bacterium]|nr:glucose-1-phosphate adenylyltransferase [Verrucomicrobiota bacterium]